MEIDGVEKQWKNWGSDVGPLSRKARVKQWKSNGKIAVSMCDHYGVEAQKKTMEETSKTVYTVQL